MYLISCDPGISGAFAIFENNKLIDCVNIKKTKDINAKNIIDFHRTISGSRTEKVVLLSATLYHSPQV